MVVKHVKQGDANGADVSRQANRAYIKLSAPRRRRSHAEPAQPAAAPAAGAAAATAAPAPASTLPKRYSNKADALIRTPSGAQRRRGATKVALGRLRSRVRLG